MFTGTADISEIEQDQSAAPAPKTNTATIDDINTESIKDPKELVRRRAAEAGLDPELVSRLANQESGFNQKAISPKGAIGVMQLMPDTARRLGVNPRDLHQNVQGGIAELKRLMDKYQDIRTALAAYNAGEGAVDRHGGIPPYKETQNYVNTIAPIQKGTATVDQIDSQTPTTGTATIDEIGKPAPVVNVGGPGRAVAPNIPASVPSYQQITPEIAQKYLNKPRFIESQLSPQAELAQRNQIAQFSEWQKQHGARLAELEAKEQHQQFQAGSSHAAEGATTMSDAERRELASLRQTQIDYQAEIDKQRPTEIEGITKLQGNRRLGALSGFVQKHGALTDEERTKLGLPTDYLSKLAVETSTGAYEKGADLASGVLRVADFAVKKGLLGETPDEFLQRAADYVQSTKQINQQIQSSLGAQNESGLRYAGGVAAHVGGEFLPSVAGALVAPEIGIPQTLLGEGVYWGGTGGLEAIGRNESAPGVAKAVATNLVPIFGARIIGHFATGSALQQFGQRVLGNAALNATLSAAQGGDLHANLTAAIMGGFMGIGGHENIPDAVVRKVLVDPEFQADVAEAMSGPKLFIRAYPKIEARLEANGLSPEQATQFTESLKSTPKENQNATQTGIEQQGRVGEYQGTPQRAASSENVGEVRGEESEQNRRSDSLGQETQGQVASIKAFITKADEAELRNRGYTEDQIYKMKPDEAQRILSRPATVTHDNPDINGRPVVASTSDGRVVVENPNNISGVSIVKDQTPVNEFEAPKGRAANTIENRTILQAVRALGRIKVDQDTVEKGELSQFSNKEAPGQGLIGPNGKLTPDYMREALEQEGFRDPGSSAEPGSPGSLSLDGMYELMDQEQRGHEVRSAFRDANEIDRELAAEYEKYQQSHEGDVHFEQDSFAESEWNDPESPLRQSYEDVIRGNDPDGEAFRYVAGQHGISSEATEALVRRAIGARESLPPVEISSGVSGGGTTAETAPEEGRTTGIKRDVKAQERAERGLTPVEIHIRDAFPEVFDKVKSDIDSGKMDIRKLTEEWRDNRKSLNTSETAALIYDAGRLHNNKYDLIDEITDAIARDDKATEVEKRAQLAVVEDALQANDEASRVSGTEWSDVGRMRQMMINEDYSFARLERQYKAIKGEDASPEVLAKLKDLSEKLEDAQRAINKRDDIISNLEAERWARTQARREAASGRRVKRAESKDKLNNEFENQKDALKRLFKANNIGTPGQGLGGPEAGAVDPALVTLPYDVVKLLGEMALNRVKAGFTKAADITDSIHESIKDEFDITKQQIQRAWSGYGKKSQLSQEPVAIQLREVKRQGRLLEALDDALKGKGPERSGLQRDKPSQVVRELTRQVNEAMRKNGIETDTRTPEERWASALDGVKTRLRNSIEDLNKRIATGEKAPERTPIKKDAEALALQAERDRLAGVLKDIEGPKRLTDQQRVEMATKAVERSIKELDRRIAAKELTPKAKEAGPTTPELEALRKQRDARAQTLKDMQDANPDAMNPSKLAAYKKRLATQEADLIKKRDELKAGTYVEPPKPRELKLDPVARSQQAQIGRLKDEIGSIMRKAQLENRTNGQKVADFFVKWRRAILLSNPVTLAKLSAAAASRVGITPVEEGAGAIISHIPGVSDIAAKAPREGGASVKAEAGAMYDYFKTMADVAQTKRILKTGKSDLDAIYGTKHDMSPEAIEFFGRTHKVMKAPAQAAEFRRSYIKRTEWALKNNLDPTDPVTEAAIGSAAYIDANRAILMQDNMAVSLYRQSLARLRAPGPDGKPGYPNVARALEFMLPIVKVPTNFVGETANYAAGGLKALNVLRRANWDVSKLTPEQADSIMRSLKKQFVGVGLFALGYAQADRFGGYYQQGEKRKEGAPKAGELQMFGYNIPHWLLHSPAMEIMQMGATFKHVMDAHGDYSPLGKVGSGALAGTAGLVQQVPFFSAPTDVSEALHSDAKAQKFIANYVGGTIIPPLSKTIAQHQDEGVVRKPQTIGENIKMMIPSPLPFNRKTVPTDEQRKQEKKDQKLTPAGIDKTIQQRIDRGLKKANP